MILTLTIILFSIQFVVAVVLQIGKYKCVKNQRLSHTTNQIVPLTIIIPFHNEEKRILPLINYLNQQQLPPHFQLLFVNDHSSDQTVDLLSTTLKTNYQLIENAHQKGKKWAILTGVNFAKHPYIVTWDADVVPAPTYFQNIQHIPPSDLVILPVQMNGKNLAGDLASIEFAFLQTLTFGAAGFNKHLLCNGANLAVKKAAFLKAENYRSDYNQPSGDDFFLLQAIQKMGGTVSAIPSLSLKTNRSFVVSTNAPSSFKAVLQQRKRWLKKVNFKQTPLALLNGAFLALVQVGFIVCLIGMAYTSLFLIPILLKISAEYIAAQPYFKHNYKKIGVLLVYQFWYPFYILALLFTTSQEKRWEM